jgi:hypothetical protein
MGPLGLAAWATMGPCGPTQSRGPTPEPSRNNSVQYLKSLELFQNPKIDFPYMSLILRTILEPLMMFWISSETLNKNSFTNYPFYPSADAH